MKFIRPIIASLALATYLPSMADDCQVFMGVAPMTQGKQVPEAVSQKLMSRLTNLMAQDGVVASGDDSQFFVSGRFDDGFFDRNSSGNYLVKTTLTLYIGDAEAQKMYASRQFELKGAGKTEQLAYMNALKSLNAGNPDFQTFVTQGREKILDYFNANYSSYLTKARTAMKQRDYDQAMYWASRIPECCRGYNEAVALITSAYSDRVDYEAEQLLAQARAAWAAHPDEAGAEEAHSFLTQIDPAAKCHSDAKALSDKIAKVVKTNWDFENVTKYKDAVEADKRRVEAARQIGVAWAQNQPKTVNRYYWVSRYR